MDNCLIIEKFEVSRDNFCNMWWYEEFWSDTSSYKYKIELHFTNVQYLIKCKSYLKMIGLFKKFKKNLKRGFIDISKLSSKIIEKEEKN